MKGVRVWTWMSLGAVLALGTGWIVRPTPTQSALVVSPLKAGGIYSLGEKAGWSVSAPDQATAPAGTFTYSLRKNNLEQIQSGTLDLSKGDVAINVSLKEPAMLYLEITPSAGGTAATYGAAVAPRDLKPSLPPPDDFDLFWASKIRALKAVPENAVETPADSGSPEVEFSVVKMDQLEGHVYGQIAKPKKPGKFPALLLLQWASPPYPLQKSWVVDRAKQGWLTLDVEPHDVLPDQPDDYYRNLPDAIKNYTTIGQEDKEKNYFVRMYLGDYRAVDYLMSRPDWDGKTLVVMGTSMGGQQSLVMAGLHRGITHLIVNEPSGCDMNGEAHGRLPGYPNFPSNNPKVMETARYIDPVNFASHIRATSLVAMGFTDTAAPPAGIWTAFNLIRGPKEAVPMFDSPHNNLATSEQQRPFNSRSEEWLRTLVNGGKVTPKQ